MMTFKNNVIMMATVYTSLSHLPYSLLEVDLTLLSLGKKIL